MQNVVSSAERMDSTEDELPEEILTKSPVCIELVQSMIREECDAIKELLLAKNLKYGNSALDPCRVFSKCGASEAIRVRLDDKLSRIKNGNENSNNGSVTDEDTLGDAIGYLVLLKIAIKLNL